MRHVVGEVVRAVDGINDPQVLAFDAIIVHLFAEDGVVGEVAVNELADALLRFDISIGDEVVRLLAAHGDPISVVSADNIASQANRFAADFKLAHWTH